MKMLKHLIKMLTLTLKAEAVHQRAETFDQKAEALDKRSETFDQKAEST